MIQQKHGPLTRSSMLACATFAAALSVAGEARAQLPYLFETDTDPYVSRFGGNSVPFFDFNDGDGVVNLPFTFRFFRESYNTINIGVNGFVAFGESATAPQNQDLPSTTAPNTLIAPFWDDLFLFMGNVTYYTEGTSPNRTFIVQWQSMTTIFWFSEQFDMQLWLYESPPGRFEMRYGPAFNMNTVPFSATAGFEGDTGQDAHEFLSCGASCVGTDFPSSDTVFRATLAGGTDIYALGVDTDVTGTPLRLYQGIPFDAHATIASFHDDSIGPFVYSYYLLGPGETAPTTPPIWTSAEISLGVFEQRTTNDSISVPLTVAPGRYRIAVVMDTGNQITEPEENNNTSIGTQEFLVGERAPDLQITDITPDPGTIGPGTMVNVSVTLTNAGNLDSSSDWRIVLSQNRAPSASDLVLASSAAPLALAIGESQTLDVPVMIPATIRPGRYYFGAVIDPVNSIVELNETNNAERSSNVFDIELPTVDIVTTSLPIAYQGQPYETRLVAAGGDGVYVWELMGGTMPAGLTFVGGPVGEIRGTPTEETSASLTFRVSSNGDDASRTMTLDVHKLGGPLTIVTRSLLPGVVGQPYPPSEGEDPENQQRLLAVGGEGEATFALVGGAPSGIVVDTNGYIHGTPESRGTFSLEVSATDGSTTVMRTIPFQVVEPGRLTLVIGELPEATLGEPYSYTFYAVGQAMNETLMYGIDAASMTPPGLSIGIQDGVLSGTPMAAGTFTFAVRVVEGGSANAPTDTASATLRVVAPPGSFSITPTTIPDAQVGVVYSQTFEARQGVGPFDWTVENPSGALPPGLLIEEIEVDGQKKLRISGTPTALPSEEAQGVNTGGVVSFLVKLDDSQGRHAEQAISLRVLPEMTTTPGGNGGTEGGGCGCNSASSSNAGSLLLGALFVALVYISKRR